MIGSVRSAFAIAASLCCLSSVTPASAVDAAAAIAEPTGVRNVVFVVADDLNLDIACYGHPQVRTPHLDRLAARGVRFSRAYCNVPLCNPSRAAFLSGRRTSGKRALPEHWLPNFFAARGFLTVQAGKVSHGYGASHDATRWEVDVQGIDEAVAKLREKHDRPLFLAVGLSNTHGGTYYDRKFRDLYPAEKIVLPEEPADVVADVPAIALRKVGRRDTTPAERREHLTEYYSRVSTVDAYVGRLMEVLDTESLWDSTVFVFTSDHGKHTGDHGGLYDKRSLFEKSVQIPLIVAAPGVQPGVSPRTVELIDVYPTLLDLCGLAHPPGLEGHGLAPLLAQPDEAWPHPAITASPMVPGAVTMRTERHRFTRWGKQGPYELYDHEADPQEHKNLAPDPQSA
ncbi:MAG: sulfatase-like hydrolase/transferase, partial [Planctomycetales bacterium]